MNPPDQNDGVFDQQRAVERRLCDALIEASPKWWRQIDVVIERGDREPNVKITSPEGHREKMLLTPQISEAVVALVEVYRRYGVTLERATYSLRQESNGWTYEGEFRTASQS